MASVDLPSPYALPFVVAVSGHRDLHPDDAEFVGEQLFQAIELIAAALPCSAIHFLSALADGADQLFAEQVLKLQRQCAAQDVQGRRRIELIVPLPMPFDDYCIEQAGGAVERQRDPAGFEERRVAFAGRFLRHSAGAGKVFVIPPAPASTVLGASHTPAEAAYAQLTRYFGIHAQMLVAVWDGQSGAEQFPLRPGGTLDLVHTLFNGVERNQHRRSSQRFGEPARGNLLHVYSRRAQSSSTGLPRARAAGGARLLRGFSPDGGAVQHWPAPQPDWAGVLPPKLKLWLGGPLRASERWAEYRAWRTVVEQTQSALGRALDAPALAVLYRVHAAGRDIDMLNRSHREALLARDPAVALRYADSLRASGASFLSSLGLGSVAALPAGLGLGLGPLLHTYSVLDVQAERTKRFWRYRWRFMALAVILASAAPSLRLLSASHGDLFESVTFAVGAFCAVGTYLWVALSPRRNAYLDYRALAEGLRFQMYWLCAGEPALVTDHYARRASGGMGWVRHALDACLVVHPLSGMPALRVLRGWIDDQLAYLNGASFGWRRRRHSRVTLLGNNLLLTGLLCSVSALAMVLLFGRHFALPLALLLAGMKLSTGVGAAWLSLATKMGHGETLVQADHLRKLYARAEAALARVEQSACSSAEKEHNARDLVFALGKAVLEENASWLAAYQQRRLNWHGR